MPLNAGTLGGLHERVDGRSTPSRARTIYYFGCNRCDGDGSMRALLGGKGANLHAMTKMGLPVPPGFTITTEMCVQYLGADEGERTRMVEELFGDVRNHVRMLEAETGRRLGDEQNPLLVSVRSGARDSMPGMMDTVLNLGLNDDTVAGLAAASGSPRFAYDSYRRFIQMYSNVVLEVDHHLFEEILERHKDVKGVQLDTELDETDLKNLVKEYKVLVEEEKGEPFPQDPKAQLWGAIGAVFDSWMNHRAKIYRKLHDIPESWGTAVNIQAMVFGNMGQDCATGVAFTRDPSTGENIFYGEYLVNAQGEDVVAGIRTPQHLTIAGKKANNSTLPAMEEVMPEVFKQLGGEAPDLVAQPRPRPRAPRGPCRCRRRPTGPARPPWRARRSAGTRSRGRRSRLPARAPAPAASARARRRWPAAPRRTALLLRGCGCSCALPRAT